MSGEPQPSRPGQAVWSHRGHRGYKYARRSRGPRLLLMSVVVFLVLAAVVVGGYFEELRPVAAASAPTQTFTVSAGEGVTALADNLKQVELIRSRLAFVVYVNLNGLRSKLQAGTYSLSASSSSQDIASTIAGGRVATKHIIVPEGYTLAQITKLVASYGISATDFAAALRSTHTQSFLSGRPTGVNLEGYLFPDSYQVAPDTIASDLVDSMLDNFGQKVAPTYGSAFAAEGLTLHQGLTLASIVEKEVATEADRPIVAQIFLKRLNTGMQLGSDVTVQYAADLLGVPFNIAINSPYNTRLHTGLPPGPICNPGLSALDAVAHPANTDYLYFLADKNGKMHYAKTYEEHQRNISLYLN